MDDDEVTSGAGVPDPLADFLIREEFDDGRGEDSGPESSHRRGMLAGLAGVAVLLAVLVVVAPGGTRAKPPEQDGREIASYPTASASAAKSGFVSSTPLGISSSANQSSTASSGSGSPWSSKPGSTEPGGAARGQTAVVTQPDLRGDPTPTAGGTETPPTLVSASSSAPTTVAPPPPPRPTTTTAPIPPRTTTTAPAPPRSTTTTTPAPPTTTTTTICVLIICL